MSMSAEGQSFSITAEADVDNATKQAAMTMDLGMMGGEMEMVMDDGVIYMRSPAFEDAPTPWVSLDPSKMDPAAAAQFGGFGAGTTDPSAYAGLFAGVFDVKASGEADIDGIATTRYTGTIDLQKVLEGFADVVGEDADAEDDGTARSRGRAVRGARHRGEDPVPDLDRRGGPAAPPADHDGLRRPRSGDRGRGDGDDGRLLGVRRAGGRGDFRKRRRSPTSRR